MGTLSVSVVIPTHNRANLVSRAIDSALDQCRPGDEIIVIDDGSTDHTSDVLHAYGDRIRWTSTAQAGAGVARNRGISAATGDLVAFLDSDDEWMAGSLELHRRLHDARPETLLSFSNFSITTTDGRQVRRFLRHWHNDGRDWDEILAKGQLYSTIAPLPSGISDFRVHIGDMYLNMAREGYIFTSTVMVKRIAAGDALVYEEDLPLFEDWLCFGRLCQKGEAAYLDTETAWQHAHPGPRLTDAGQISGADARLEVLGRLWGQDPEFLQRHGELYERLVDEQYHCKAAALIKLGQTREARTILRLTARRPWRLRLLSALPGGLARQLLGVRRRVRRTLGADRPEW